MGTGWDRLAEAYDAQRAEGERRPKADNVYSTAEATRAASAMHMVPTSRHGVNVEWHVNGCDIEVEFDSTGKVIGVCWERTA